MPNTHTTSFSFSRVLTRAIKKQDPVFKPINATSTAHISVKCDGRLSYQTFLLEEVHRGTGTYFSVDEKAREEPLKLFAAFMSAWSRTQSKCFAPNLKKEKCAEAINADYRWEFNHTLDMPPEARCESIAAYLDPRAKFVFSDALFAKAKDLDTKKKSSAPKRNKSSIDHTSNPTFERNLTPLEIHCIMVHTTLCKELIEDQEFQAWVVDRGLFPKEEGQDIKYYSNHYARSMTTNPSWGKDPERRHSAGCFLPLFPWQFEKLFMITVAALCHQRCHRHLDSVFGCSFLGRQVSEEYKNHYGLNDFEPPRNNKVSPILETKLGQEKLEASGTKDGLTWYEFQSSSNAFQRYIDFLHTPILFIWNEATMIIGRRYSGTVPTSKSFPGPKCYPKSSIKQYKLIKERHLHFGFINVVADMLQIASDCGAIPSMVIPADVSGFWEKPYHPHAFFHAMLENDGQSSSGQSIKTPPGYCSVVKNLLQPILSKVQIEFGDPNKLAILKGKYIDGSNHVDCPFFMKVKEDASAMERDVWEEDQCEPIQDLDDFRLQFGEPFNCNLVEMVYLLMYGAKNPFGLEGVPLDPMTDEQKLFLHDLYIASKLSIPVLRPDEVSSNDKIAAMISSPKVAKGRKKEGTPSTIEAEAVEVTAEAVEVTGSEQVPPEAVPSSSPLEQLSSAIDEAIGLIQQSKEALVKLTQERWFYPTKAMDDSYALMAKKSKELFNNIESLGILGGTLAVSAGKENTIRRKIMPLSTDHDIDPTIDTKYVHHDLMKILAACTKKNPMLLPILSDYIAKACSGRGDEAEEAPESWKDDWVSSQLNNTLAMFELIGTLFDKEVDIAERLSILFYQEPLEGNSNNPKKTAAIEALKEVSLERSHLNLALKTVKKVRANRQHDAVGNLQIRLDPIHALDMVLEGAVNICQLYNRSEPTLPQYLRLVSSLLVVSNKIFTVPNIQYHTHNH